MYRVAVIQNESEMQRTGYANVIAKLRSIKLFKKRYKFDLYTVVNISDLFENGINYLDNYDSLIITTNATSDKIVLEKLQSEKTTIEKFIEGGKGLFISSQKKLSKGGENGSLCGFLPEEYDFYTTPRPEESSGEGKITFNKKNKENNLLKYPNQINDDSINKRCQNNEFMKHFYRSHTFADNVSYLPILEDKSYDDKTRILLSINSFPKYGERIILSTIALDWEFHEELLINIIAYITEGFPKIAFLHKQNNSQNFQLLSDSADALKISYKKYSAINEINSIGKNIHSIYLFSEEYSEQEINNFITTIEKEIVYQIKQENDVLKFTRYSNYSSTDTIINKSVAWLKSLRPLNGKMWNDGFWTTFEILSLLCEIQDNDLTTDYISTILNDIKTPHYNKQKRSYDRVISATCGLIQLLLRLKPYQQSVFDNDDLNGMISWVIENFGQLSIFDKRSVLLTLSLISDRNVYVDDDKYGNMITTAVTDQIGKEHSEIEICQIISVYLLDNQHNDENIKLQLKLLQKQQSLLGDWNNNIGRTAHVIIFLLQNIEKLQSVAIENINIIDMIYRGIVFLRSKYNGKNWGDKDIQATAKATHAILLYNKTNHASMYYDIIEIINHENSEITFLDTIKDLTDKLKGYRVSYNQLKIEKQDLQLKKTNLEKEKEQLKKDLNKSKTTNDYIIYGSIIIIAILVIVLIKETINIDVFHSIIAGFATAIILGGAKFATKIFNKIKNKSKNKIQ